ncbi:MAG: glutamine amidotransferase, partial [Planctomycetota bacterium]
MFGLHFLTPIWFLALLLLPLVVWHGRRSLAGLSDFRRWASMVLRVLLVLAAILALTEACWRQISREVTVVYLVDRSASVPSEEQKKVLRYMRETATRREKGGRQVDDRAGLVVFGEGSSVELAPSERFSAPQRLHSIIETEHTDIAEGLRMAAASFPAGARKRIVLISDGAETKGLALEEARRLGEMGVRVECLHIGREKQPEVMVDRLVVRQEARAGEPVQVRTILRADQPASGELELFLDGRPVAKRRFRTDAAGKLTPETFAVRLPGPGFYPIEVRLRPDPGCDTVHQNNVGYAFTQLRGKARVLILHSGAGRADPGADVGFLARALAREKIEVRLAGPAAIPTSNAELAGYDCVILANVGAYAFTKGGMEAVRSAVRDMGVGLIMIGGPDSFGAGGYLNTPIEEALPVSCEVRQRKVMPNGALALIMHTCEMPQPNYWGRRISKAAIDALSDQDQAGMLLYDWNKGCSWLFKMQQVGPNRAAMANLIKNAQPGDMPAFDPSMKMALAGLKAARAAMKHCIIISDGDPSLSDPTLVGQFKAAKITISTIAIAPHGGMCVGTLKRIANATGGRYYYPKNPNLLPQIFVKEAMTVRRSVIFNKTFTPINRAETDPIKGFWGVRLPQLDGYVVTTARDRAEVPLTVKLEGSLEDPVLAHWRYGEGKAVAFTSSAASDWASHWIGWPGYVKFWAQIVRWASRAGGTGDLQIRSDVKGGTGKIVVEAIDEKGRLINYLNLTTHVVDP